MNEIELRARGQCTNVEWAQHDPKTRAEVWARNGNLENYKFEIKIGLVGAASMVAIIFFASLVEMSWANANPTMICGINSSFGGTAALVFASVALYGAVHIKKAKKEVFEDESMLIDRIANGDFARRQNELLEAKEKKQKEHEIEIQKFENQLAKLDKAVGAAPEEDSPFYYNFT